MNSSVPYLLLPYYEKMMPSSVCSATLILYPLCLCPLLGCMVKKPLSSFSRAWKCRSPLEG